MFITNDRIKYIINFKDLFLRFMYVTIKELIETNNIIKKNI